MDMALYHPGCAGMTISVLEMMLLSLIVHPPSLQPLRVDWVMPPRAGRTAASSAPVALRRPSSRITDLELYAGQGQPIAMSVSVVAQIDAIPTCLAVIAAVKRDGSAEAKIEAAYL
jgi:hypothetical protein